MLSRITIEVNFENNNEPVIQIHQQFSDDVRDKLIQRFLNNLKRSKFCKIEFINSGMEPNSFNIFNITPIEITQYSSIVKEIEQEMQEDVGISL